MTVLKRTISTHAAGSNHWVGDGFPVRNMFPSNGVEEEVNPFLMLDYAGPAHFEPTSQRHGVGFHPHRGFETVTIAYQGSVEHKDSKGNHGVINPGDVQWMTAASGILHEEMHSREFARTGGTFEMVQLWVNLPKQYKMSEPKYQTLMADQFPRLDFGGGSFARLIAGDVGGLKGPAHTFTPINLLDVRLTSGGEARFNLPSGFNTAIFLMDGEVAVHGAVVKGDAQLAVLDSAGGELVIEASKDSKLLVLNGQPIREPVVSYGPFVMNTKAEILQAVSDFQSGAFGKTE